MRTTIDIDPLVLAALKRRQLKERKTLGALVSELLAVALADEPEHIRTSIDWPAQHMEALIDIDDREALWAVLDAD